LADPAIECNCMQEPTLTLTFCFSPVHPLRSGAWLLRGCHSPRALSTAGWLWNVACGLLFAHASSRKGSLYRTILSSNGHWQGTDTLTMYFEEWAYYLRIVGTD
jgi:hypothetical protein